MRRLSKVFLLTLFIFSSTTVIAEENMQMSQEEMGDFMAVMVADMVETMTSPKVIEAQARYYKNFNDALIKQGFSKKQAFQIIISKGSHPQFIK